MRVIFKYIKFVSTSEFEAWQRENPKAQIQSVMPIITGMDVDAKQPNTDTVFATGYSTFSVFVVYVERED